MEETYRFSPYGDVIQLPHGKGFSLGRNRYLDLVIEGVGTKVLVAQLAKKYDALGIDGVVVAVNEIISVRKCSQKRSDNFRGQNWFSRG